MGGCYLLLEPHNLTEPNPVLIIPNPYAKEKSLQSERKEQEQAVMKEKIGPIAALYRDMQNAGIEIKAVAKHIGISRPLLSYWFVANSLDSHKAIQVADALRELQRSIEAIEDRVRNFALNQRQYGK